MMRHINTCTFEPLLQLIEDGAPGVLGLDLDDTALKYAGGLGSEGCMTALHYEDDAWTGPAKLEFERMCIASGREEPADGHISGLIETAVARGWAVVFVTSRDKRLRTVSAAQIERVFGPGFPLIMTGDKGLRLKEHVISTSPDGGPRRVVFVDDKRSNLESVAIAMVASPGWCSELTTVMYTGELGCYLRTIAAAAADAVV